ncbi:MAG TPA: S4 domain-containing protein [Terriglobales bacterium]|nr:S4 domain-containing protein [Terriglobales bacterium]
MRLDVLLFELRLFKSRTQAADAVRAGHVLLNGEPSKPSHEARAGDRVTLVRRGEEGRARSHAFEILELPRGSLSREAARALIREVAER